MPDNTASQPCPNALHMGEFACNNQHQCWEPCGKLGKDPAYARVSRLDIPLTLTPSAEATPDK